MDTTDISPTSSQRRIAVVTSCRADWGLLHGVVRELQRLSGAEPLIVATNMHLNPDFGLTVDEIEADGFPVAARVEMNTPGGDTSPLATASAAARCLDGMARAFADLRPDIVLILGDRYEMLPVATAATILRIPLAHIAGGEISEGAFDDNIRHALTKLSSLHFTATYDYRRRVIQMGEHPSRVFYCGALGVQNLMDLPDEASVAELEQFTGVKIDRDTLLVTFHPATLDTEATPADRCRALLDAIDRFPSSTVVFTYPNNDPGGEDIISLITAYANARPGRCAVIPSLGRRRYLSMLRHIGAVAGNSSSGIVEVPSAGIPTVDIGIRQKGRTASRSVIHCGDSADEIAEAIARALSPEGRAVAASAPNPYSLPGTAARIAQVLSEVPLDSLSPKRFFDLQVETLKDL